MRRILLTGATGTIGSAVVPRLLENPGDRVTLLVRAPDDAQLQSRRESMLAYWGIGEADPRRLHLEFLRGDNARHLYLTLPQWISLGLVATGFYLWKARR